METLIEQNSEHKPTCLPKSVGSVYSVQAHRFESFQGQEISALGNSEMARLHGQNALGIQLPIFAEEITVMDTNSQCEL